MRLFTAIDIPFEQKKMICDVSGAIHNTLSQGRMVSSENYHITLEFLGDVTAESIKMIEKILSDTAGKLSRFDLSLDGSGKFRSANGDIVYLKVVDREDKLAPIVYEQRKILLQNGFKTDNRKYVPHVTLYRDAAGFVPETFSFGRIDFSVCGLSLFESCFTGNGGIYRELYKASLT